MTAERFRIRCLRLHRIRAHSVAAPAAAQDYYAGQTIDLVVGSGPAGGYDIYGRALARHIGRHIPGKPNSWSRTCRAPAAPRRRLPRQDRAQGWHRRSPPSCPARSWGRSSTTRRRRCSTRPRCNTSAPPIPARASAWAARQRASGPSTTCAARKTPFGGGVAGRVHPRQRLHAQRTAGAKFEVIAGYHGTTEIGLAMERGEVDGSCGWDWSSVKAQSRDWLRDKKLNFLLQIGLERNDELTKMGVPHVWDFVTSDEDRKVVELVIGQQVSNAPTSRRRACRPSRGHAAHGLRRDHERPGIPGRRRQVRIDISPLPGARRCRRSCKTCTPPRRTSSKRARRRGDPDQTRRRRRSAAATAVPCSERLDASTWHAPISDRCAMSAFRTPHTAQDFYAGKTIELVVGHYAGGGYDIYARALARHSPGTSRAIPRSWSRTCRAPAARKPGSSSARSHRRTAP